MRSCRAGRAVPKQHATPSCLGSHPPWSRVAHLPPTRGRTLPWMSAAHSSESPCWSLSLSPRTDSRWRGGSGALQLQSACSSARAPLARCGAYGSTVRGRRPSLRLGAQLMIRDGSFVLRESLSQSHAPMSRVFAMRFCFVSRVTKTRWHHSYPIRQVFDSISPSISSVMVPVIRKRSTPPCVSPSKALRLDAFQATACVCWDGSRHAHAVAILARSIHCGGDARAASLRQSL